MASPSGQPAYMPSEYWTAPKRNFRSSARLHMMHALFQKTLGNQLLHPTIEAALLLPPVHSSSTSSSAAPSSPTPSPFRIADLGCGNAVWLADLHASLAARGITDYQLDGFDINPVNFPPAHTLPPAGNIRLAKANVLDLGSESSSQPELDGVYDVVHLRAWCSVVTRDDPSRTIAAAIRMLKPGGFIQWEETRVDRQTCSAPPSPPSSSGEDGAGVTAVATETLINTVKAGGAALGQTYSFVGKLGEHLAAGGFEAVTSDESPLRPTDMKAWTENQLLVWEEIPDLLPSRAQARPGAAVTKESFTELFGRCVAETEAGVVAHQEGVIVVTGRKPI